MQLFSELLSSRVITKSGSVNCSMRESASAENSRAHKKLPLGTGPMFPRFSGQDIADDCLAWVIDVARQAGAEWNWQPWRWIVVRGEAAKNRLEAASSLEVPLSSAPVVLICLADTHAWKSAPQRLQEMVASAKITEEEGREVLRRVQEYYSSSPEVAYRTALANGLVAVQQVLLGAASCGLAAYWVTEFDEARIKAFFHVPDHFAVAALLPLGYREEGSAQFAAKPGPHALIYQEKFGKILNP
jgi:nitroreductase